MLLIEHAIKKHVALYKADQSSLPQFQRPYREVFPGMSATALLPRLCSKGCCHGIDHQILKFQRLHEIRVPDHSTIAQLGTQKRNYGARVEGLDTKVGECLCLLVTMATVTTATGYNGHLNMCRRTRSCGTCY